MNKRIREFCLDRGMRTFGVDDFFIGRPLHLYARDGIHLGRRGIAALYRALKEYIGYNMKYGMCMGVADTYDFRVYNDYNDNAMVSMDRMDGMLCA
jgi:hypothetical protein